MPHSSKPHSHPATTENATLTAMEGVVDAPIPARELQKFTPYQKFVVAILAFLQFTIILDFMILSPLGAILMPTLHITPAQFGLVVSAYAFSAGISGLLAAGFADRFDRKKLLLFFYTGFVAGTLFCGLAPTYEFLLAARIVTGVFGGVIGSIVFAITTDLFPFQMRGRVMGVVQTAFAASQVLGIPLGLMLSNSWGWHAPFLLIVGVSLGVGLVIVSYLQPIDAHLKIAPVRSAPRHLLSTVSRPRYLQGYATTALLSTGGFMMMPFGSSYMVQNLGVTLSRLPMVYMVTGVSSMLMGPGIGRLSDRYGKFRIFALGSVLMSAVILVYTRLPAMVSLAAVLVCSVLMFAGISARMISSSALMSAMPDPSDRGAYMAVSASLQQMAGGVAAILAGMIVSEGAGGIIEHFDGLGNIVVLTVLITIVLMLWIERTIERTSQP